MLVKIDQFAPDADYTVQGVAVDMSTMVPSVRGYKAAPTATDPGFDALASACYGAAVVRKLDNATRYIAGTATKLYELTGTSWTDVTRLSGGDYGASADVRWDFAQFGNVTLATNKADTLQYSSGSGNFANVATAPKAKLVETVNQFVFVADTDDVSFGDSPDRWWCAAIGTYDDWTPDIDTQSVSGRLTSSPGRINAIKRLGDGIVMYKDRAIYVGSYVGAPEVWSFQEIPGEIGCMAQGGIVNIGTAHVFVGYDNFYIFDGSRPTPIGNLLKDWFFTNLYTDYAYRIRTLHDRSNSNVYFFYPSRSGAGALDKCVVYNYRVDKWGVDDRTVEETVDYVSAGLTFDGSFATTETFATVDPSISFDSPLLVAGQPAPAFIDTSHETMLLTGLGDTWSFTSNDFGDDNAVSLLRRVRPRFLTQPTSASMINYYRMVEGATLTTDATTAWNSTTGAFDVLRSARWHRLHMAGSGGGELGAFDVQLAVAGAE
jgi:hypothetical protein